MSTTPQKSIDALARIRSLLEQERVSETRSALDEALVKQPKDVTLQRLRTLLAPPKIRRSKTLDTDRMKDFQWLAENGAQHRGSWVAIHEGELVAEAGSLDELLERVGALDLTGAPLIHLVA